MKEYFLKRAFHHLMNTGMKTGRTYFMFLRPPFHCIQETAEVESAGGEVEGSRRRQWIHHRMFWLRKAILKDFVEEKTHVQKIKNIP